MFPLEMDGSELWEISRAPGGILPFGVAPGPDSKPKPKKNPNTMRFSSSSLGRIRRG